MRCLYKCQRCDRGFSEPSPGPTQCPFCGNLYVDWLNYESVIGAVRKPEDQK
jgi:hypothetical protein